MEFIVEKIGMSRTGETPIIQKNSCNNIYCKVQKVGKFNNSELGAEEKEKVHSQEMDFYISKFL